MAQNSNALVINGSDHSQRVNVNIDAFSEQDYARAFTVALAETLSDRYGYAGDVYLKPCPDFGYGCWFDGDLPSEWNIDDFELCLNKASKP